MKYVWPALMVIAGLADVFAPPVTWYWTVVGIALIAVAASDITLKIEREG